MLHGFPSTLVEKTPAPNAGAPSPAAAADTNTAIDISVAPRLT